jgi:hypothetical protein
VKELSKPEMSAFTFNASGLSICFAPYAVGAYAEGTFHAFIPWSEVRPQLRRDGPARLIPGALEDSPTVGGVLGDRKVPR